MCQHLPPTPIIQNSIPVSYDFRVEVKPCEPNHVPYLPVQILYLIAKTLPQPKQVFNLALTSKEAWEYLQPALYECEVTYEARLAHKYGGQSSTSAKKYYSSYRGGDADSGSDSNGVREGENKEDTASAADHSRLDDGTMSMRKCTSKKCHDCDFGRIFLEKRRFDVRMPDMNERFRLRGAMTALQWASIQGASALPVARKAIRAALAHQPSYINGLDLIERYYHRPTLQGHSRHAIADHPPPLFLAVAHGNIELCQALIFAGADVGLLLGRTIHATDYGDLDEPDMISYKIHQQCVRLPGRHRRPDCIFELKMGFDGLQGDYVPLLHCQTAGHVAVRFEQTEMLKMLLRNGLDVSQGTRRLIQKAVMQGNLAAVRVLLDHDPSLVDSVENKSTPMHLVPFILLWERKLGSFFQKARLKT